MAHGLRLKMTADKSCKLTRKVINMKTKLFLGLTLATLIFSGNLFAAVKPAITFEQAQEIALKRIKGGEVEKSDTVQKHNKPVYSFFIKDSDGIMTHILVNEKGKIIRLADETPDSATVK